MDTFIKSIDFKTTLPIIISIISLVISVYSTLKTWRKEKFRLDFDMIKWFGCNGIKENNSSFFIWLSISNNSSLPCSIIEIQIRNRIKEKLSDCDIKGIGIGDQKLIATIRSSSEESEPKKIYSFKYPVNIDSYSSIGGYFHVVSDHGFHVFEDDYIDIVIKTNRGKIKKKIFMDYGKNIFRVIQNKDSKMPKKRQDGSDIVFLLDDRI